ncbi:hypothetical protein QTP88_018583 [Uroleucon formosanum]
MEHNNTNVKEYLVANVIAIADIKINNNENDDELSDSSLSSCESSQNNSETPNEEDGNYTKDNKPDHSYSAPSWLQHLSYGGLTEPTVTWVEKAKVFENMFKTFYKDKINPDANIVKRLSKLIKKKCYDMPENLIKSFVLQRTYIRIKQLNNNLIATQKRPYNDTDRKSKEKMKKITT